MSMSFARRVVWLSLSVAAACGDDGANSNTADTLSATGAEADVVHSAYDGPLVGEGADGGLALVCPRGGNTGPIRVEFYCGELIVVTCKDLSNVVLELEDGTRTRFEGLKGHQNRFVASAAQGSFVGVWVKAGNNKSGDGPGYGERFDAPAGACTPPPAEACSPADGSCTIGQPPVAPPPAEACSPADGSCTIGQPPVAAPPAEACSPADGSCTAPQPPPPKPAPPSAPEPGIGF
jgi:hypothetical protein